MHRHVQGGHATYQTQQALSSPNGHEGGASVGCFVAKIENTAHQKSIGIAIGCTHAQFVTHPQAQITGQFGANQNVVHCHVGIAVNYFVRHRHNLKIQMGIHSHDADGSAGFASDNQGRTRNIG